MARISRSNRVRYSKLLRKNRSRRLLSFLKARQQVLNGTGNLSTITYGASNRVTWTGHGKAAASGPYALTTTGALPTGLQTGILYWIKDVVDANTVTLTTKRGGPVSAFTGTGTGTHSIARASNLAAMFEWIRQGKLNVLRSATDVDNI